MQTGAGVRHGSVSVSGTRKCKPQAVGCSRGSSPRVGRCWPPLISRDLGPSPADRRWAPLVGFVTENVTSGSTLPPEGCGVLAAS